MVDARYKEGDSLGTLQAQLKQDDSAFDLDGYSVDFVLGAFRDDPLVDASATITDEGDGKVEYDWQPDDLSQAGTFYAEFIADDGTDEQTFPDEGYLEIVIEPQVKRS